MFRALARLPVDTFSHHVFRVAMGLSYFTDHEGLCYASVTKIAKRSGVHRRAVFKALLELERLGFIAKISRGHADRDRVRDRKTPGGFQATNYYQLLWVNPVNALTGEPGSVQRMPGVGGAAMAPPLRAEGGAKSAPKVVPDPTSTLLTYLVSSNGGAARREPSRWDGVLKDLVHQLWRNDPLLGGAALVDAMRNWIEDEAPTTAAEITNDDIGAAIDVALHQKQVAASMRRPHHRRKRA